LETPEVAQENLRRAKIVFMQAESFEKSNHFNQV
jgi:hypothetical protein